jgi:hypothetical protein
VRGPRQQRDAGLRQEARYALYINDAVIGHLKGAAVALAASNAGDAAASVQAAIRSIKALIDKVPD